MDGVHWQWEVKSVNGKALDVRFRLPPGCEALEAPARAQAAARFRRGTIQVALAASGNAATEALRLNFQVLDRLVAAGEALRERIGGEPLRADVLLGLRGVIELGAEVPDEAALERRNAQLLATFEEALDQLERARRSEGERLHLVIEAQVQRIAGLAATARASQARTPEMVRARLAEQVARLMEASTGLDLDRLHQEAVLLATRSDITEELDRLDSHVAAARALIADGEAIGRKFDFLAQEFNREANTLCSKAADLSLTAIGLELKTVIDQLREQVQNIE
jgi:uncharacterized protein (TIGR00255 family)